MIFLYFAIKVTIQLSKNQ